MQSCPAAHGCGQSPVGRVSHCVSAEAPRTSCDEQGALRLWDHLGQIQGGRERGGWFPVALKTTRKQAPWRGFG